MGTAERYSTDIDVYNGLAASDLEQIVSLSGLEAEQMAPQKIAVHKFVSYAGREYKVRAYRNMEAAREKLDLARRGSHLFAEPYGRVGRFAVLEYVRDQRGDRSQTQLVDVATLFAQFSKVKTPALEAEAWDRWCGDLKTFGIFRPETIQCLRRYYARASTMPTQWGLEYYIPWPPNFVVNQQDQMVSVDEKHVYRAPRGVCLVQPAIKLSTEDFLRFREAYSARLDIRQYDDPQYREFLLFYYCVSLLAFFGRNRESRANLVMPRFRWMRRDAMRIAGVPLTARLLEETRWRLPARWAQLQDIVRRFLGFVGRRLNKSPARRSD